MVFQHWFTKHRNAPSCSRGTCFVRKKINSSQNTVFSGTNFLYHLQSFGPIIALECVYLVCYKVIRIQYATP